MDLSSLGLPMPQLDLDYHKITDSLNQMRVAPVSEVALETILDAIREFEAKLDNEHEVGMHLASFGQAVMLRVAEIRPDGRFLIFRGWVNEQRATLVQNVSQLNFLLLAVPKADPEKPPRRIGFVTD